MTILDAQSKNTSRARAAIVGLMSRGAYIKAFYGRDDRNWKDHHLVIDGQRHEANKIILKGIAESGKATIIDDHTGGCICFYGSNLSARGKSYAQ